MKILITGVSGLIGQSIAQMLYRKGHQIVGLSRQTKKTLKKLSFLDECYLWNGDFPSSAFKNVSAVINLAGAPIADKKWTPKRKKILMDSRVQLTEKLVEKANQFDSIQTLISTSAIGYYGHRKNEELDESSPPGRGFTSQLCSEWEKAAQKFKNRVCIFRCSSVLSDKGGLLKKLAPVFKCGLGVELSSGRQWMSWIHLQDLVQLYTTALEQTHWSGVFNASSLEPVTNQVFTQRLAHSLNRPAFLKIPQWALEILLGERSSLLWHSQKVLPVQAQKKGFIFEYPQLDKALSHLSL